MPYANWWPSRNLRITKYLFFDSGVMTTSKRRGFFKFIFSFYLSSCIFDESSHKVATRTQVIYPRNVDVHLF